jgi:nucleotide-binding universal stress UspA family protein
MFKSIIWATDGSEGAAMALPLVRELAEEGGSAITVVHVIEHFEGAGAVGPPLRSDEYDVQAELKRITAELSEHGFKASLVIRPELSSRPANEIAEIAREIGADLIVTGTRGHTALGGFWVGSVTNRLLHISPCPVLVVPPRTGS